jgi:putative transposase
MTVPQGADQRWSLDRVADTPADGRRFRVPCMADDVTREALPTVVDTSISGARVVREPERLVTARRLRAMAVTDNGTEPTSVAGCAGRRSAASKGTVSRRGSGGG